MELSDGVWSLVVALVGVGGALYGTLRTQRQADKRAIEERAATEAREEARNRRDEAARTHEHRREAYTDYLKSFETLLSAYYVWEERNGDEPPPEDALDNLFDAMTQVKIYGSHAASDRAGEL